jgi:hypothetical protein
MSSAVLTFTLDSSTGILGTRFLSDFLPRAIGASETSTYIRVVTIDSSLPSPTLYLNNCKFNNTPTSFQALYTATTSGFTKVIQSAPPPYSHYTSIVCQTTPSADSNIPFAWSMAGERPSQPAAQTAFYMYMDTPTSGSSFLPPITSALTCYGFVAVNNAFAMTMGTHIDNTDDPLMGINQAFWTFEARFEGVGVYESLGAVTEPLTYTFQNQSSVAAVSYQATVFQATTSPSQVTCVQFRPQPIAWSPTTTASTVLPAASGGGTFSIATIFVLTNSRLLVVGNTTTAPSTQALMLMNNVLDRQTTPSDNNADNNLLYTSPSFPSPAGNFFTLPGTLSAVYYVAWWQKFSEGLNGAVSIIYTPDATSGQNSYSVSVTIPSLSGPVLFGPIFIKSFGSSDSTTAYFLVAGDLSDEIVVIKIVATPSAANVFYQAQSNPFNDPTLLSDVGIFFTDSGVAKMSLTTDVGTFPTCTVTTAPINLP